MAELTISQIIKMIVAIFIIAIVVFGAYFAFKNYIIPYFKGFSFNETTKLILSLL